jgi:hypothetical protein
MASTRAVVQSVFESFVDDVKSNKRRFCLSTFVVALAKVLPRPCPPGSILLYGTWHGAGKLKAALQAETDDGAGDASAMLMDEGVCLQSVLRITRELVVVLTRRDTPGSSPFLRSCLELLNQLRRKLVVERRQICSSTADCFAGFHGAGSGQCVECAHAILQANGWERVCGAHGRVLDQFAGTR